ncbi:hypothetical protein E4U21_005750 [Claviceps maximensis]|nr:hypothetical protein E4U21_005750 [Claviceps maximensis]
MPSSPYDDMPETCASTAAEKAFSSLRARLRSEDFPPSQEVAVSAVGPEDHVYAKLQAIFSQNLPDQVDSATHPASQSRNLAGTLPYPFSASLLPLLSASRPPSNPRSQTHIHISRGSPTEIFALYGQETYNLSLKTVRAAHESISGKITAFHAQAASTSAHAANLYNNISYPLSATLCQAQTFPSASLGRHIRTLHRRLSAAETELGRLNEEWKRCAGQEARILSDKANAAVGEDSGASAAEKKKMDELVARIDDIVQRRSREIDELNEEYRDLLWAESNRMMQAMMAD